MSKYSEKITRQRQEQQSRGFFKVADLHPGQELTLEIMHLAEDQPTFEGELKDVLYFEDLPKQLVVNLTNANTLIEAFGDDPAYWPGHKVTLYLASYGRSNKQGIRIKPADPPSTPASNGGGQLPPPRSHDFDDDIPY